MKPTIVILHGWGLSKAKFEPLITELKNRGYSVVAPDFPGFGESINPEKPMTLSDYARFLHQFLNEHTSTTPILIGHSFGGRVSLRYQSLYPKSVRTLILTGTPGFTPIARKKLVIFIAIAKLGKFFFSLPGLSFFMKKVRTWYYYVVGAREYTRATGSMQETFKNIVKESLVEDMKQIAIPTLLLWGENDIIVPVKIALRMKELIPNSRFISIPNSDHGVPYKSPIVFSEHVEKFLQSIENV